MEHWTSRHAGGWNWGATGGPGHVPVDASAEHAASDWRLVLLFKELIRRQPDVLRGLIQQGDETGSRALIALAAREAAFETPEIQAFVQKALAETPLRGRPGRRGRGWGDAAPT